MTEARRFEALVLPHLDAGYNLARWLLHDPHDARDATHDACLRAMAALGSLRAVSARPWFLTIVRHACYDWICRNPRPGEDRVDDLADADADPSLQAERRSDSRALDDAVAALPRVYREVVVLREIEGLSYLEIAAVAAIPIGTVMSRLARARRLLRRSPLLAAVATARSGASR